MLRRSFSIMVLAVIPSFAFAQETAEVEQLQIGDEAPRFALRTLDGKYELLTRWTGEKLSRPASQPIRHVVLVSFFATW